jgi:hypothetical protein
MDNLVRWLNTQLDEDERIARAATAGPWSRMGRRVLDPTPPSDRLGIGMAVGHAAADADFNETADHIAAHDPARVLREIDAKRQILTLHRPTGKRSTGSGGGTIQDCSVCQHFPARYPCTTLRFLVLPYSDRPGYQESWRP